MFFDINRLNLQGQSPVFLTIPFANAEMLNFLLENNCDLTQREQENGETVRDCIYRYCAISEG